MTFLQQYPKEFSRWKEDWIFFCVIQTWTRFIKGGRVHEYSKEAKMTIYTPVYEYKGVCITRQLISTCSTIQVFLLLAQAVIMFQIKPGRREADLLRRVGVAPAPVPAGLWGVD